MSLARSHAVLCQPCEDDVRLGRQHHCTGSQQSNHSPHVQWLSMHYCIRVIQPMFLPCWIPSIHKVLLCLPAKWLRGLHMSSGDPAHYLT